MASGVRCHSNFFKIFHFFIVYSDFIYICGVFRLILPNIINSMLNKNSTTMAKELTKRSRFEILSDWIKAFKPFFNCSDDVMTFIVCQVALESDFLESDICKNNLNVCGMRYPRVRPTAAVSSANGFAVYEGMFPSMIDYFYLLCYNHVTREELSDLDKYCAYLVRTKYCSHPDYINSIKLIYYEFRNFQVKS